MRPGHLALAGVLLVTGLAALVIVARSTNGLPPLQTARGVLLDVQAGSLVHAERVTLRADDGRIVTFRVDPEVAINTEEPQSASHLRQHMAFGEPLLVRYRETAAGPVALRILDAP